MAGLDDLDLDDMFNDDGDNLFDGLDIELDGTMGDIISSEKSQITVPVITAPPPKPKRTGPRTMRRNPMLEKEEKEAGSSGDSNRRKTKRKSKAPTPYGDEDDVETQAALIEMHQPKKKRKAALKAKQATEEVALANQVKVTATATTTVSVATIKRKKKGTAATATSSSPSAASMSTGIPSLTGSSNAYDKMSSIQKKLPTVAAAGRFGAGVMKRGSPAGPGAGTTTKVKRKLKKTVVTEGGMEPPPSGASTQPRISIPKAEPTYCGIPKSRVLFYPFLDGIPSEATLPKRKAYPVLDKVSSALTSTIANSSSSSLAHEAAAAIGSEAGNKTLNGSSKHKSRENSAVFKLMLETYGVLSEKEKEKTGSEEKRAAILAGMSKLREEIDGLDKTKLVRDVFSVCWLLTRQYNLLKRSLENMEHWCKDNFTEEDYQATYEEELEQAKLKLRKWPHAITKVKIVLPGFKEPKGASQLEAALPPFVVSPLVTTSNNTATVTTGQKAAPGDNASMTTSTTKNKKQKSIIGSTTSKSTAAERAKNELFVPYPSLVTSVPKVPKTYADSSPQTRRQLIVDRVAHLAIDLEHVARQAPAGSAGQSLITKNLESVANEDPPLNTARMWEWLQSAGFYRPLDQLALRRLALHRAPEVHPRGFFLSTATKIQTSDEHKAPLRIDTNDGDAIKAESGKDFKEYQEIGVVPDSLFDRLQALLVEETSEDSEFNGASTTTTTDARLIIRDVSRNSNEIYDLDDEGDEDWGDDEGDDDEDESFGFLHGDQHLNEWQEQRTSTSFVTVKKMPPPIVDLSRLSLEERTFLHLSSAGLIRKPIFPPVKLAKANKKTSDIKDYENDDLVGVVGAMASDLSTTTALNNSRISFLQASKAGSDLISNKQVEEEQAALIARCQNMLKRSKEKAKKAKAKKLDSLNLPW